MTTGRATIRTLARELGVHPSTVSRALDTRRVGGVSDATIVKIRALAQERGYEPDPWARSLRTRKTHTVGLLMPRLTDPVIAAMFEAAEDRARDFGYQALTLSTRDQQHEQRRLVDVMLERRVDGLILATPVLDDPLLPEIEERGVSFVLLNRASEGYVSVHGDDEAGGYLATRHLLGQGHRRVAMIAGPANVSTARLRLQGYVRAHEEFAIVFDPQLVLASMFAPKDGVEAAARLLTMHDRPTAVFAFNDSTALGALAVARDLHLRVPEDLAVVGYNDTEVAPLLTVPLTSVALPVAEMGRAAVDILFAKLENEEQPPTDDRVFTPRLVARASSLFDRTGVHPR